MTVTSAVRIVAVTAGAREYVWTQVTEINDLNISASSFKLALAPYGSTPDDTDFLDVDQFVSVSPSVVKVALLVDELTVSTRGEHQLWARVVDVAETVIFAASGVVMLV